MVVGGDQGELRGCRLHSKSHCVSNCGDWGFKHLHCTPWLSHLYPVLTNHSKGLGQTVWLCEMKSNLVPNVTLFNTLFMVGCSADPPGNNVGFCVDCFPSLLRPRAEEQLKDLGNSNAPGRNHTLSIMRFIYTLFVFLKEKKKERFPTVSEKISLACRLTGCSLYIVFLAV